MSKRISLSNFSAQERTLLDEIHQRVEGYKKMQVQEPGRRIARLKQEILTLKRLLLEARSQIQPCAANADLLAAIDAKLRLNDLRVDRDRSPVAIIKS